MGMNRHSSLQYAVAVLTTTPSPPPPHRVISPQKIHVMREGGTSSARLEGVAEELARGAHLGYKNDV